MSFFKPVITAILLFMLATYLTSIFFPEVGKFVLFVGDKVDAGKHVDISVMIVALLILMVTALISMTITFLIFPHEDNLMYVIIAVFIYTFITEYVFGNEGIIMCLLSGTLLCLPIYLGFKIATSIRQK